MLALKTEEGGPKSRKAGDLQKLEKADVDSPPSLQKGPKVTTGALVLAQGDVCHTFDQWNCQIIHLNCLKPLSVWSFVTAAIGI